MTVTANLYRAELARINADGWAARPLKMLLLDKTSTYVFDATDQYVSDVISGGGVEGTWTSYARETLSLSAPTIDGSERWQLLCATADFGIIGTSAADETAGAIVYDATTDTSDSTRLLVAHFAVSPTVDVWDGTNPFTVTIPGTGLVRTSA